jgi:signal transduction histidine kinase
MKKEINRLADTVNVFFQAQQRVNGERELDLKMGDILFLIKEIVKEKKMMKRVRENNIQINVLENTENIKQFKFDVHQMTEVLSNLIDNAINYTKSFVKISLKLEGENVVVFIKDDGIGVNKDDMSKLFNRFARAENAIKHKPDGSGLGLYVVKQIVELHNGKIWVESGGENKGSTFFVSLPYKI